MGKARRREQKSKHKHFSGLRGAPMKAGHRHEDKRKQESKKACRGKVDW